MRTATNTTDDDRKRLAKRRGDRMLGPIELERILRACRRLTADGERASGRAPSAGRCRGVDRMGGGRMPHVLGETAPVAGGTARAGVGDHPVGDAEARRQPNACGGAPSDEPACDPRDADSRRAGRREHGHYLVVTCFRSSRHIRMRAAQTFTCAPESAGVTRTPRSRRIHETLHSRSHRSLRLQPTKHPDGRQRWRRRIRHYHRCDIIRFSLGKHSRTGLRVERNASLSRENRPVRSVQLCVHVRS